MLRCCCQFSGQVYFYRSLSTLSKSACLTRSSQTLLFNSSHSISSIASAASVVGNPKSKFWLFHPDHGFDLTHPSSPDQAPSGRRIKLPTTTIPVTVTPNKTALIIIDIQNLFLSPVISGNVRSTAHEAKNTLLRTGIPATRNTGIQMSMLRGGFLRRS